MKPIVLISTVALLCACNNSKKDKPANGSDQPNTTTTTNTTTPSNNMAGNTTAKFTVNGQEIDARGSLLVSKDKDNLKDGMPYLVIMTAPSGAPINETLTLNFLLDLKTGTYPVVGMGLSRDSSGQSQLFGGILGGKPKLTNYNVNITEMKDLGSNSMGGHRWSISGTADDLTIPAMPIMLMDKSKNHPAQAKVEHISFNNLSFDDNWEELMKKAVEQMKKN